MISLVSMRERCGGQQLQQNIVFPHVTMLVFLGTFDMLLGNKILSLKLLRFLLWEFVPG